MTSPPSRRRYAVDFAAGVGSSEGTLSKRTMAAPQRRRRLAAVANGQSANRPRRQSPFEVGLALQYGSPKSALNGSADRRSSPTDSTESVADAATRNAVNGRRCSHFIAAHQQAALRRHCRCRGVPGCGFPLHAAAGIGQSRGDLPECHFRRNPLVAKEVRCLPSYTAPTHHLKSSCVLLGSSLGGLSPLRQTVRR